jgi:hypothetical protein
MHTRVSIKCVNMNAPCAPCSWMASVVVQKLLRAVRQGQQRA